MDSFRPPNVSPPSGIPSTFGQITKTLLLLGEINIEYKRWKYFSNELFLSFKMEDERDSLRMEEEDHLLLRERSKTHYSNF